MVVAALLVWTALPNSHILAAVSLPESFLSIRTPTPNERYAYVIVQTGPVREKSSTQLSAAVHSLRQTLMERYAFKVEVFENSTATELWERYQEALRIADSSDDFLLFFFGSGLNDPETGQCSWILNRQGDDTSVLSHDVTQRLVYTLPARHVGLVATACPAGRPSVVESSVEEERTDFVNAMDRFRESFQGKSVEVIDIQPSQHSESGLYRAVDVVNDWLTSMEVPRGFGELVKHARRDGGLSVVWRYGDKRSYGHRRGLFLLIPDTPLSTSDATKAKDAGETALRLLTELPEGVRKLQEFLNSRKCFDTVSSRNADGFWGPRTEEALERCQSDLQEYVLLARRGNPYIRQKADVLSFSWLNFVSLFLEPALAEEGYYSVEPLKTPRLSPIGVPTEGSSASNRSGIIVEQMFSEVAMSLAERQFQERYSGGQATILPECDGCPTMQVIPPGEFVLGEDGDAGSIPENNAPALPLILSYPLAVSQTPITADQWRKCVEDGGCDEPMAGDHSGADGAWPVVDVSWADAQDYVEWLYRRTQSPYRLLSEAEWEYVASGGNPADFWWGDHPRPDLANFASEEGSQRLSLARVDAFATAIERHPFGMLDVVGNTWEIVDDCRTDSYLLLGQVYGKAPMLETPPLRAPSESTKTRQPVIDCRSTMVRGGSWADKWGTVTVRTRSSIPVDRGFANVGFRVAKDLPIRWPEDNRSLQELLEVLLDHYTNLMMR